MHKHYVHDISRFSLTCTLCDISHTHTHTLQLFDLIRSERPAALEKVVPISGDCWEPGLGIGESDQQLLAENVSIIFHLAATIKFDEPIRSVKALYTAPSTIDRYTCRCNETQHLSI